jgi:hypothetical protein
MFALNEFALKHRYALVLHTDEAHPHVHLVVKAESEQGEPLNIRKATLRHWREQFALHLRELGVEANATERAVRGESKSGKKDGMYRAARRGQSTRETLEVNALIRKAQPILQRWQQGIEKLRRTRVEVEAGWFAVAERLHDEGDHKLAEKVRAFVGQMEPPATDQARLLRKLVPRVQSRDMGQLERTR